MREILGTLAPANAGAVFYRLLVASVNMGNMCAELLRYRRGATETGLTNSVPKITIGADWFDGTIREDTDAAAAD